MNKRELIDILENLECSTESLSYDNGYEQGVYDSLSHVILLDEPKKVVVPKFVAKKIESYDSALEMLANEYFDQSSEEVDSDELACWIDGNVDLFFKAWLNGYEVETKQLYYVDVINDGAVHKRLILDHENGKHNIVGWSDNLIGLVQEMFTEQEIKAIDERYWPFAVKVDGKK
ncbi:DUF1642 domain-containing protein [Enterococcus faecalis]|uniref:DUF1642 domain-containing protein n=1 Tax=Enterococcus faecalis TaxID=1351 RepID=A0A4U3KQK7_ENTFL|nr:DUF1642 domain-containing protein [Enterococcus faecalis]TKK63899.1 DUF1642 domain-containing protein [Enterococcus faecalis]